MTANRADPTSNRTFTMLIQNNDIGNAYTHLGTPYSGLGGDGIPVLHRDGTKSMNLTIDNNRIASMASEGIRYFTDDDVGGGGPGNALKVSSNTFSGVPAGIDAITLIAQDPGTDLCTHVSGTTGLSGENITLQQSSSATLQITRGSAAALSAANDNVGVTASGTITTGGTCTTPSLPTNP